MSNTPKVREFRDRKVSVERHHPDGGTFHLLSLDIIRAAKMNDALAELDYERDDDGKVIIDEESETPKKRTWRSDGERIAERVNVIRQFCVERVTNLVDADQPKNADGSWNFIEMDEARINSFLAEVSTRPVERVFPKMGADGQVSGTQTRTVPANEPIFAWVTEECGKLAQSGEAAEVKNSSSTPVGSSETAAL